MNKKLYGQTIFDNSPYGLVVTDLEGLIIDANPIFAGLVGYSVQEIRNYNYQEILSSSTRSDFKKQLSSVCSNGSIGPDISHYKTIHGNMLDVAVSATKLEDDGQQIICWFIEEIDRNSIPRVPSSLLQIPGKDHQINAAQVRSILDSAVDGIITINEDGVILSFNPSAEQMFGYSEEEVIGKNVSVLMPSHYGHNHDSYISNYLKSRDNKIIGIGRETKAKRKDGSKFDIHLAVSESTVAKTRLFTGIIRDISEKKQADLALQESEEKFRLAFEGAAVGMALVSPDGKWMKVNDSMCNITGFSRQELISSLCRNLVHPEDVDKIDHELNLLIDYTESSNIHTECRFISKSGEIKWLNCSISLIREPTGIPLYYVFQLNDITRRINVEKKLYEAREQADNANKAKSQFLYNMSHELRTPLTAILGFADILESSGSLEKEQLDDIQHIKKASHLILQIVKDVLDLAKIEAGQIDLHLKNINLFDLVKQCCQLVRKTADDRNIKIVIEHANLKEDDLSVYADELRSKQAILNLLSNAIKYNKDNGSITINYHIYDSGKVRLSITDTGYGIPENKLDKLFQPFNRLGAESGSVDGTGIGLVIIKSLLEKMGGEIGVLSTEGKGSTFWIEFQKRYEDENMNTTEQVTYASQQ